MKIAITTKQGDVFTSTNDFTFMDTFIDRLNSAREGDFVDFGTVLLRAVDVVSVCRLTEEEER